MTTHPIDGLTDAASDLLAAIWIPVGVPGFSGVAKAHRQAVLDERFGCDGWRFAHVVGGRVVSFDEAIGHYEASYRQFLRDRPTLVAFLTIHCGNVYDDNITNVHDHAYVQPHTAMNHYQDISVRRVISELVDDDEWPDVNDTPAEVVDLRDFDSGTVHRIPRARGFHGDGLLQIREPQSLGYLLSPAVVPMHDQALLTSLPNHLGWYHHEGCAHLSVEAFLQMSKVVEVRYDRFVALGAGRANPLADI
jgi:hypothetical protein